MGVTDVASVMIMPADEALNVIITHHLVRDAASPAGPITGQWRHEDAIGQLQIADCDRIEEGGHEGGPIVVMSRPEI